MQLHPNFKLNGTSFTREELIDVGYSLVKEGEPFEAAIGDFLLDWLGNSEIIQVKTSGSTGKPKKIGLSKEHMANSALATGKFFGLSEKDTALLCLPAEYIAGKMMLVRAMVLGWQLDYMAPNAQPLKSIRKAYDFCAMVPMQVENSLSQLYLIKTLIIGGAPVSRKLREKLASTKTEIYETYGMTETITHVAAKKIGGVEGNAIDSFFEVLPDVSIRNDDRGCLVIECPKISNNTIVTNDLVKLIDGRRFQWLGRWDNVINSGGIKLIPEEIERKLGPLISNRFFVTGTQDDALGEKVVLVKEGVEEPDLKDKISALRSLTKFEIPKTIFVVPKFIETTNGKVNRKKTLRSL